MGFTGVFIPLLNKWSASRQEPWRLPGRHPFLGGFGALGQDATESQRHSRSPGTKSVEICNSYVAFFYGLLLPYFFFNNENGTTYFFGETFYQMSPEMKWMKDSLSTAIRWWCFFFQTQKSYSYHQTVIRPRKLATVMHLSSLIFTDFDLRLCHHVWARPMWSH